jgi:hypothetical protein
MPNSWAQNKNPSSASLRQTSRNQLSTKEPWEFKQLWGDFTKMGTWMDLGV